MELAGRLETDVPDRDFDEFVAELRPRLVRALIPVVGIADAADGAAEALAYAFEHWAAMQVMANPAGHLYRVGRSRVRHRKTRLLPPPSSLGIPEIEPGLIPALATLPESQRTAVWLVHACEWRYAEVAEAIGTSVSMVGNHATRGPIAPPKDDRRRPWPSRRDARCGCAFRGSGRARRGSRRRPAGSPPAAPAGCRRP